MKHNLFVFIAAFAVTLVVGLTIDANQNFKLTSTGAGPIEVGDSIKLNILFNNEKDDVLGWSMGVCHDGDFLSVTSAANGVVTQALNMGFGPALFFYNLFPNFK